MKNSMDSYTLNISRTATQPSSENIQKQDLKFSMLRYGSNAKIPPEKLGSRMWDMQTMEY